MRKCAKNAERCVVYGKYLVQIFRCVAAPLASEQLGSEVGLTRCVVLTKVGYTVHDSNISLSRGYDSNVSLSNGLLL